MARSTRVALAFGSGRARGSRGARVGGPRRAGGLDDYVDWSAELT